LRRTVKAILGCRGFAAELRSTVSLDVAFYFANNLSAKGGDEATKATASPPPLTSWRVGFFLWRLRTKLAGACAHRSLFRVAFARQGEKAKLPEAHRLPAALNDRTLQLA
jgi:hypothetical protein